MQLLRVFNNDDVSILLGFEAGPMFKEKNHIPLEIWLAFTLNF
jgi:hypothetical protein